MRWFGARPWAPACEPSLRTEIPTGAPCGYCEEPIEEDAFGVLLPIFSADVGAVSEQAMHAECFLRQLVGSLEHQLGFCGCLGSLAPDPPPAFTEIMTRLSLREQAVLAVGYFMKEQKKAQRKTRGAPAQRAVN